LLDIRATDDAAMAKYDEMCATAPDKINFLDQTCHLADLLLRSAFQDWPDSVGKGLYIHLLSHVAQHAVRDNGLYAGCQSGAELKNKEYGKALQNTTRAYWINVHRLWGMCDADSFTFFVEGGGSRLKEVLFQLPEELEAAVELTADLSLPMSSSLTTATMDSSASINDEELILDKTSLERVSSSTSVCGDIGFAISPLETLMKRELRMKSFAHLEKGGGAVIEGHLQDQTGCSGAVRGLRGLSTNRAFLRKMGILLDTRYLGTFSVAKVIVLMSQATSNILLLHLRLRGERGALQPTRWG